VIYKKALHSVQIIQYEEAANMFYVSEIQTNAPETFKTDLQKQVYETLDKLAIPFERVDTDEAITMEDCVAIDERLQMKMVKTLFLCSRRQTDFYLFITCGDKPFRTKEFSTALGISRVSFAPAELMETMLGAKIGAATVFSALFDKENKVQIVFDKDVLAEKYYGCSDGTTTGYMKIETQKIKDTFLAYAKHTPAIISV
jgi:Ala-tRNA(Pro) deacylase